MTHQIKVYTAKICPFAQRTLIALIEKNINYDAVEIDLKNKPEWYNEVSPYGKVPAIVHDDKSIFESNIINEYIDEIFPGRKLLSEDAYTRAMMRIWMAYCGDSFTSNHYQLLRSQDNRQQQELSMNLIGKLHFIENEAFAKNTSGDFFFGEKISIVDICFYPFFKRFCVLKHYRGFTIPAEFTRIHNWIKIMEQRESVKQTNQSDEFYIEHYRPYSEPENN